MAFQDLSVVCILLGMGLDGEKCSMREMITPYLDELIFLVHGRLHDFTNSLQATSNWLFALDSFDLFRSVHST